MTLHFLRWHSLHRSVGWIPTRILGFIRGSRCCSYKLQPGTTNTGWLLLSDDAGLFSVQALVKYIFTLETFIENRITPSSFRNFLSSRFSLVLKTSLEAKWKIEIESSIVLRKVFNRSTRLRNIWFCIVSCIQTKLNLSIQSNLLKTLSITNNGSYKSLLRTRIPPWNIWYGFIFSAKWHFLAHLFAKKYATLVTYIQMWRLGAILLYTLLIVPWADKNYNLTRGWRSAVARSLYSA